MGLDRMWATVVILILLKGWWNTNGCWEQERIALLQLKTFFNRPNFLQDWVDSEKSSDCCQWESVECNTYTGRVIHLYLDYSRDKGSKERYLNVSLFLPFEKLEALSLLNNGIAGWVENAGFERLSSRLSNLKILDLSYNSFNESIFSSLSQFSSLKSLYLVHNNFTGSFQNNGVERLQGLINLEVIDLSYNQFDNSILSFLGGLSSLKSLYIIDNQLKGSIQIKDALCNLEELDISENEVKKLTVPEDNRSMSKLKVLYLEFVSSAKCTLQSLGPFPSLKTIYLQGNNFIGTMTTLELHNLTNVEELFLDFSSLQTHFLLSLGALTSLKNLSLSYSEITGTLSAQDSINLKNLEHLDMRYTSVDKSFLQCIGGMNSLKVLLLSDCGLSGTLPAQGFCELMLLQDLDIRSNDFGGNLPECIANFTSLQSLNLYGNQFTGYISPLKSLTSLQYLDLSSNQFTGYISSLKSLTSLQYLDLSSNQFIGYISPLKSLTSIQYLSLSDNHFQIPISLAPFFNHSKLKEFNGLNNEIYAETESHSLAPKFQLNSISLSGYGYGGALPKFLYHQHDLQEVDLSHIHFRGEFPNWLLENNTRLHALYLVNISLSGPFQVPSFSHINLSRLDISNNILSGNIPIEVGAHLPRLKFLNMSENGFDGSIPSSFGYMKSLEVLDLSNNNLSSGVPEHLTTGCLSLQELILSKNSLQGQIFSMNFSLKSMLLLQLDGNNFTGRIPDSLSNCSILEALDISNNHLFGRIPEWLGNMSELKAITLANNHLEGPIPTNFCQLDLEVLDLSENNISKRIPSCFSPPRIKHVRLSKNRLQGPLTDAFYNCSSMVTLDLSNNHFTGSIPDWIDRLSQLSYLLLKNNDLEGQIPIQMCQLKQLSLIDLSHNNFFGLIPYCLIVTSLEEASRFITMAHTLSIIVASPAPSYPAPPPSGFSTQEPVVFTTKNVSLSYEGRVLTYMSGIDLSCNKLTGEIPPEIGNLNEIRVLNLSHNHLSGSIPPTFANLRQIESLDLSNNNLSGKIPPELVELNFLSFFSVAHNNFSGKIPVTAQFGTFDKSSYEANPLLCGTPLPKSCDPSGSPSSMPKASTDSEEDNGFIDMTIFYVSFTVTYMIVLLGIAAVLYINPYWRRVWFYHIEMWTTSCFYFVEDNLPKRFRHGIL